MENKENVKDNTKKRIILGSLIIVMSVVIIGISISYAYYLNVIDVTGDQGTNLTSGNLSMSFATDNDQYINATSASLINDSEVTDESNNDYTQFTISFASGNTASEAYYNIYLTDITMTQNLKSSYVKWALYETGNLTTPVATGTFNDAVLSDTANEDKTYNADDILLTTSSLTTSDTAKSYRLYIWLSNDPDYNQISLLDGKLNVTVGFRATTSPTNGN